MSQINPFKGYATPDLMLSELLGDAYEFLKPLHSNIDILQALGMSIDELRAIYDGFIAGDGIQAKIAILLDGFEHFFGTFAEAIAARPVGSYFTTNAAGRLKIYQRTDAAPFYIELSASTQPVTWDQFTWDNIEGKPDHFDIDPSELEAIVTQAQGFSETASSAAEVALQAKAEASDQRAAAELAMEAAAESRDAAGQHAEAASGFAVQAETAVTDAGEFAQAAQDHATSADTSRSNAYTSEQAASQARTDALEAKSLANIAAQAAAAAANQAGEQAEAAAGWAGHAESKATEATQKASAALLAQTKAETASAQAESFLQQMSESGGGDEGASAAAALSAQVAAQAATTALAASGNEDFGPNLGTKGWYTTWNGTTPLPDTLVVEPAWEGNSYLKLPPGEYNIFSAKKYQVDTSRRYRIKTRIGAWLNGAGGTPSRIFIGFACLDAAGNLLDHGAYGTYRYAAAHGELINDGQLVNREAIVTGEGNDSYIKFAPGTKQIKLVGIFGYQGTTCNSYCDYITWEDIDAVKQAEGHASAAAGFRDEAGAQATAAGLSAQAAHNEFLAAQVQVGLAAGKVTDATNQANLANDARVLADQAAASALSSSVISASVGGATFNKNPVFNSYPSAGLGNLPTSWENWASPQFISRASGMFASPYAIQMQPLAGYNCGVSQRFGSTTNGIFTVKVGDKLVIEAELTLLSGSLRGGGVLIQSTSGDTTTYKGDVGSIDFAVDADATGALVGAGEAGRTYSFRKVITSSINAELMQIFAMATWAGFDGSLPAKNVIFHRVGVRPASSTEALEAYVKQSAGAAAYAAGRSSAWLKQEVNAGAAGAFFTLNAETDTPEIGEVTLISKWDGPGHEVTVRGRNVVKTGGATGWYGGAFSKEQSYSAAYCEAQALRTDRNAMFGFTRNPRNGAVWDRLAYSIFLAANGNVYVMIGTSQYGPYGTYSANDIFSLKYLSGGISFRKNGKEFASTTAGVSTTETFYFDCSIYEGGGTAGLKNIGFAGFAPTQASAVSMGAREIHLLNEVDGTYKKAMSVEGGNVKIYGQLTVGITEKDLPFNMRKAYAQDFHFRYTPFYGTINWDGGVIFWIDDNGNRQLTPVQAGYATWPGQYVHLVWHKGDDHLTVINGDWQQGLAPDYLEVCLWEGGGVVIPLMGATKIYGDRIVTGSIGADQITTGTLITASAQIGNLIVDTINVKNNAITNANAAYSSAALTAISGALPQGGWGNLQSVSFTSSGAPTWLHFDGLPATTNTVYHNFRVRRNGSVIWNSSAYGGVNNGATHSSSFSIMDTPPAGWVTYDVDFTWGTTNGGTVSVSDRSLFALELKK